MSFESEFDEFLNDVVIREGFASRNDYGETTYSGSEKVIARVVFKPELVVTGASEISNAVREVQSTAKVYMGPEPVWSTLDRITLPDGSQPQILAVYAYPDETSDPSLHHQVVVV